MPNISNLDFFFFFFFFFNLYVLERPLLSDLRPYLLCANRFVIRSNIFGVNIFICSLILESGFSFTVFIGHRIGKS